MPPTDEPDGSGLESRYELVNEMIDYFTFLITEVFIPRTDYISPCWTFNKSQFEQLTYRGFHRTVDRDVIRQSEGTFDGRKYYLDEYENMRRRAVNVFGFKRGYVLVTIPVVSRQLCNTVSQLDFIDLFQATEACVYSAQPITFKVDISVRANGQCCAPLTALHTLALAPIRNRTVVIPSIEITLPALRMDDVELDEHIYDGVHRNSRIKISSFSRHDNLCKIQGGMIYPTIQDIPPKQQYRTKKEVQKFGKLRFQDCACSACMEEITYDLASIFESDYLKNVSKYISGSRRHFVTLRRSLDNLLPTYSNASTIKCIGMEAPSSWKAHGFTLHDFHIINTDSGYGVDKPLDIPVIQRKREFLDWFLGGDDMMIVFKAS
jgi:hypothetical protein